MLRQGFAEMGAGDGRRDLYEVNMKEPIAVIDNMETVLKKPFNTTPKIRTVLEKAHGDMQMALTGLNPQSGAVFLMQGSSTTRSLIW